MEGTLQVTTKGTSSRRRDLANTRLSKISQSLYDRLKAEAQALERPVIWLVEKRLAFSYEKQPKLPANPRPAKPTAVSAES